MMSTFFGTVNNDYLTGRAGADVLDGRIGADTMIGGAGNDTYYVDNVKDVVTENSGQGTDTVISSISYTLGFNLENLLLAGTTALSGTGNSLNNVLTGNAGNNVLDGRIGADTMTGGAGNDTYYVDNIRDVVTESSGQGTDTVISSISYTLGYNLENLLLTGTTALRGTGNSLNNVLTGNAGNNVLDGGTGYDSLIGGSGNDTLYGGSGDDALLGGTGSDKYLFGTDWGNDTILYDFTNSSDTISFLSGISANDISASLNGSDCLISMGGSHITIKNWTAAKLDKLLFADGHSETVTDMINNYKSSNNRAFLMSLSYFSDPNLSSLYAESSVTKDFQNELNSNGWDTTALYDYNATTANVVSSLQQFAQSTEAGDNVLLLFDSHGGYNLDPNYNIRPDSQNMATYDGKLGLNLAPYQYAGESDITAYLKDITSKAGPTGHVTILQDTCYAGTWVNFANEFKPQNLTVIAASDWDEVGISEAWYNDYTPAHQGFVSYAINAFSGMTDSNNDGYLSTGEMEGYLRSNMYQYGLDNNWLGLYGNNIDVVWYDASGGNYQLGKV